MIQSQDVAVQLSCSFWDQQCMTKLDRPADGISNAERAGKHAQFDYDFRHADETPVSFLPRQTLQADWRLTAMLGCYASYVQSVAYPSTA